MKIKYIFNYVATLAAIFFAVSCDKSFSEEEMPSQFVPFGKVWMDNKYRNLTFSGNADSKEITFTTNDAWKILSTQKWVSFSENMGEAGEHTITIFVDKSYEDKPRKSSLTFVVERLREPFMIEQAKGNVMTPDSSSYGLFSLDSQMFDVNITYNTAFDIRYTFEDGASPWISYNDGVTSVSQPNEMGDMTMPFKLDENTTYNDRKATVTFINDSLDAQEEFVVSQAGNIPVVLDGYESISFSYDAITEPVEIELSAAIDFDVTASESWITPTRVSFEDGKYTFSYTTLAHTDKTTTRTGYIYLSNTAENVERKIKVTQAEYNDDATITVTATDELSTKITEFLESSSVAAAEYNRLYIVGENVALSAADFTAITTKFTGVKLIDISKTATTEIPAAQFQAKLSLEQFIFPKSIETIGDTAFQNTSLTSVTIPGDSGCVKIGYRAFFNSTKMEYAILEEGVVEIGVQSFATITSPPSPTLLASISIPSSITTWPLGTDGGNKAISGCTSLKEVILAEGLKTLGVQSFASTGVESITIPSSIDFSLSTNSAGDNKSFGSCLSLSKIEFMDGLKAITNNPFTSCAMVSTVIMPESIPSGSTLGSGVGSNVVGGLKMLHFRKRLFVF